MAILSQAMHDSRNKSGIRLRGHDFDVLVFSKITLSDVFVEHKQGLALSVLEQVDPIDPLAYLS